jgi:hypothetical protein
MQFKIAKREMLNNDGVIHRMAGRAPQVSYTEIGSRRHVPLSFLWLSLTFLMPLKG